MANFFGKLLRPLRAGDKELLLHSPLFESIPATIHLTSSAFEDGGRIPALYTVEPGDISPPLSWSNLPPGTAELALVLEDYDVPFPHPMLHLLGYGILPETTGLPEGVLPCKDHDTRHPGISLGKNSMGHQRYDGPAPIPGHGPHHYVFQMLAFAESLLVEAVPDKKMFLEAIKDKTVLGTGALVGTYER